MHLVSYITNVLSIPVEVFFDQDFIFVVVRRKVKTRSEDKKSQAFFVNSLDSAVHVLQMPVSRTTF